MTGRQLLPDQLNCIRSATPVQGHSRSTMTVIMNHWKLFVIAIWELHLQGNRGKLSPKLYRLVVEHCPISCTTHNTHTHTHTNSSKLWACSKAMPDLTAHIRHNIRHDLAQQ